MDISAYILLAAVVFGINVIPAFMPPTWTILVFFFLSYHLHAPHVVIIGALFATLGRIMLYYLSKYQFIRFFSKKSQDNYHHLAKFVNKRQRISIPLFFAYAFSPIPSNQMYIMAGVSGIRLRFIATIFFLGRLISYSLWIGTAHLASQRLDSLFGNYYSNTTALLLECIGLIAIVFLGRINWKKYLKV